MEQEVLSKHSIVQAGHTGDHREKLWQKKRSRASKRNTQQIPNCRLSLLNSILICHIRDEINDQPKTVLKSNKLWTHRELVRRTLLLKGDYACARGGTGHSNNSWRVEKARILVERIYHHKAQLALVRKLPLNVGIKRRSGGCARTNARQQNYIAKYHRIDEKTGWRVCFCWTGRLHGNGYSRLHQNHTKAHGLVDSPETFDLLQNIWRLPPRVGTNLEQL